ncbi:hypothetical protein F8M41_022840 [Gigaspora margarita]|uniref:SAM domain-containing protein n=1 Tax=Gigaspora margarita TaxID=4874 RepID=A0A8H4EHX7_GIGMA|nr:hypothetical protein F8M41_022840 [Gigaspora margarita]
MIVASILTKMSRIHYFVYMISAFFCIPIIIFVIFIAGVALLPIAGVLIMITFISYTGYLKVKEIILILKCFGLYPNNVIEINPLTSDEIHEYGTKKLIKYLQTVKKLELNEKHFEIIRKVEINSENFLKITEKKLCDFGFSFGPAERIVSFAKECSEWKRQKYSSIRSLR